MILFVRFGYTSEFFHDYRSLSNTGSIFCDVLYRKGLDSRYFMDFVEYAEKSLLHLRDLNYNTDILLGYFNLEQKSILASYSRNVEIHKMLYKIEELNSLLFSNLSFDIGKMW